MAMKSTAEPLPPGHHQLQQMVLALQEKLTLKDDQLLEKEHRINYLLEQFRLAQQRQFGQSCESTDQLGLYNEAEALEAEVE